MFTVLFSFCLLAFRTSRTHTLHAPWLWLCIILKNTFNVRLAKINKLFTYSIHSSCQLLCRHVTTRVTIYVYTIHMTCSIIDRRRFQHSIARVLNSYTIRVTLSVFYKTYFTVLYFCVHIFF